MKTVAVLSFALATTILGQTAPPPQETKQPGETVETLRKLSRRERRDRIAKLDVRHQDFVGNVTPIIFDAELDTFLTLETDQQRDAFVDEFWRRRDLMQGGTGRFKEIYYNRLDVAKQQFKQINTDRAKMFLLHGPPDAVVRADCARVLQPLEIWKYEVVPNIGAELRLVFFKPRGGGDYRLWNPLAGTMAINELVAIDNPSDVEEARPRRSTQAPASMSPYASISRIQMECKDGQEVMQAITQMVQLRVDLLRLFEPPEAKQQEDAQKILRSMVIANPNAPKLDADFSVKYPSKKGSRTDVQMALLIPRNQLKAAEVNGAEVYTIDVIGEVLKEEQLWEKYRYRFDFPGDTQGERLPIVIDRFLRPNDYVSRIKITDANGGAETVVENALTVPEVFEAETPQIASATPAATAAATASIPAAAPIAEPKKPALRIIPPADGGIVSGIQTVETLLSGEGIKAVEFWLDGRKLAVRRAAPYALDLDFGIVPHLRRIRAVALDASDQPIAGDDIFVNAGTDPFGIRIVSPRIAPHLVGEARIELDVRVPDGEELGAVELFFNETRLATMYDAPFVQTITVPETNGGVGYIRAVAKLKDADVPPVEDVVMINTPSYMEELNVHLVELPTTVLVNGKPADSLTEKSFKVLDDGKPVVISKFEHVRNLPLSIGLAFDTSGSMQQRLDEAQKAGGEFFQSVMRKGDKGFLISFDKEPRMVQKWTTKVADLHAGLAKLRAEETTSLYDAVVQALYNFHGLRGQKALILISDGKDTASKFTFDQAMEYARRSAVPIYAIGIGIRGTEQDVRFKLSRLTTETGGSVYYIEQARDLHKVYDEIQTELRSQYILGFYPAPDIKTGSKWREVTVTATEGKVKTVKGYFP
ncbi:MAG TPA: VWA domain-containing protein [Thermoanaerobaculia bacterium]|nr:VWA domain-containing protein [Thermoanaerobaculia bacterium]